MMIELALATLLQGSVSDSSVLGITGLRWGVMDHKIYKIHYGGPAYYAGLQVGDKIIKVEDEDNRHELTGKPYTLVSVTVKRKDIIKTYTLYRVPWNTIESKEVRDYYGK